MNLIKWELFLNRSNRKETIAELELLNDSGKIWLNSIVVIEDYQRHGIATLLIRDAIKEFGEIYFSSATKAEHKQKGSEKDCRYLEPDGKKFVNALLEQNIIKQEWYKNPFRPH